MNYIAIYMNYMVWRYETTYSRTSTSVWIALDRTPSLTGPVDCRVVGCGYCLLTTGRLSRGGWVVGGRSPTMITMLLCSPCLETIPMHSDLKPPARETIISSHLSTWPNSLFTEPLKPCWTNRSQRTCTVALNIYQTNLETLNRREPMMKNYLKGQDASINLEARPVP